MKVKKILNIIGFCFFYTGQVIQANLRVAKDVLSIKPKISPGIFILYLESDLTDQQKLFLSNLISMTPGELSMDLDPEENVLLIHTIYLDDGLEEIRNSLTNVFERKVRNAF